jgi:spore germination protein KA
MRYFYIFLGATLGFFGISLGLLAFTSMIVSLKSFGVPLLTTIAPKTRRSNDFILRWPVWKQEFRPDYANPKDIRRQPRVSRIWTKPKSTKGPSSGENDKGSDE